VHRFLVKNNFDIAHIGHSLRMTAAIDEIRKINLPYVVTLTDFFSLCYRVNLMRTSGETCDGPHGGRACLTHCPVEGNLSGRFHYFHQFLAGARARIACSDFVRRQYVRAFPNLAFEVLPHGIDALRSCSIPPIPQEKERTGVVRFGFLGSLSKVKGVVMLLEAFAMADLPDALLEIVGPAYGDAETMHKIKLLAARSNVKIRGGVASDEVFGVLSRFDVLCLPSQVPETFSLVLHEGFACGIPALVSDLGAPAEIVRKHGCGWVISHTDVAGWAQAFRFIAHDPTILKQKKSRVPLPYRIEEEGFLYDHIYRRTGFLNHQNKSKKNEEQLKEPIRENINSKKLSWLSPIKLLRAWNRHRLFRRHLKG
jgi:glycosyltransferase involved in cell wall biosynthesis